MAPVEFKKDSSGRWVSSGEINDTTAYAPATPSPVKPKPKPQPQKNWWQQTLNNLSYEVKRVQKDPVAAVRTYAGNTAKANGVPNVGNHLRYEMKQLADPSTRASRVQGYGSAAVTAALKGDLALDPVSLASKPITASLVTAGANLARNLGGAGPLVDLTENKAYQAAGLTPPSQMDQTQLGVAQFKASVVSSLLLAGLGGGALSRVAPQLASRLNPATAPNLFQAIARAGVVEGLAEIPQTVFEDNTGGSVAGLADAVLGTKIDPVKPGMSHPEAMAAAFVPNAIAGGVLAGGLSGAGPLFDNLFAAVRGQSEVNAKVRQRQTLETAGLTQSNPDTGQSAFTPDATGAAQQPAAAPVVPGPAATTADPAQPLTGSALQDAAQRYGIPADEPVADVAAGAGASIPSQSMAQGVAVTEGQLPTADPAIDPWDVEYNPDLPEADVGLDILERLDDDELQVAVAADDPINAAADLLERRPLPDPDAVPDPSLVRADAGSLATPLQPWRSQWASLPATDLQAMAMRSAELGQRLLARTGKTPEAAVKSDLLDALDSLAVDGDVFLPSRLNTTETIIPIEQINVDPARFQFKQGVDAQGQQKGNSLSGVDKWNTSLEGMVETWDDPADGLTYVVNGHNRVAKARELGIPSLPAKSILAEDHVQARAAGALSNIASGGGTVFDAAKFFRDSGLDLEAMRLMGMPLASGTGRGGIALAQLPENIFLDAVDGKISQSKAVALGESGLSPEAMQQAYKALQGGEMSNDNWAEVLQQARSAPQVEGTQVDLFGNTEMLNLMVQKGDLARRIRAEISGDKKLFGTVKRNAGKLEAGGNQIDAAASGGIAAKAEALLTAFDTEKYAAGTAISELLNRGAQEVAAGAKPAVVARRLKQELVQTLDQVQVPGIPAQAIDQPAATQPDAPAGSLTDEQRQAMQLAAVQKAIANGKVRPPETPIPEVPQVDANVEQGLSDLTAGIPSDDAIGVLDAAAAATEHFRETRARADAAQVREVRDEVGYEMLSFEQKKALGMADGYADTGLDAQTARTLDDRAAFARQQMEQAKATGDVAGAAAWEQELRQLERSRIANARDAQATSQQGLFGVGQYDDTAPLLNQPNAAATPAIEIPAAAARKITAKTGDGRIQSAAESLLSWTTKAGDQPMSMDKALELVRAKGSILDPDKIPALDMEAARVDKTKGAADTPATDAVAAAYKQFYGIEGTAPSYALLKAGTELTHGTSSKSAQAIMQGGFRESRGAGAILGNGVYMTDAPMYASAYGDTALSGPLPADARILDLVSEGKSVNDFAEEVGIGAATEKFEGDAFFSDAQQRAIRKWASDNGYDGIRFNPVVDGSDTGAPEVVLYNLNTANRVVGSQAAASPPEPSLFKADLKPVEVRPDYNLPVELFGDQPSRFGAAELQFANDLDRAAFALVDRTVPPETVGRLQQDLIEQGHDLAALHAHGQEVMRSLRGGLKEATGSTKPPTTPLTIPIPDHQFSQIKVQQVIADNDVKLADIDQRITNKENELKLGGCTHV